MKRLIDAEPLEEKLFKLADKAFAKNPYEKARICAYRRAFEMVLAAPTVDLTSNAPLTLEELRKMDGEPVWVVGFLKESFWGLVHVWGDSDKLECIRADHLTKDGRWYGMTDILPGWLAFRRKPEEQGT